jgi:Fe-S-cluster-containing hydrogenase component 2
MANRSGDTANSSDTINPLEMTREEKSWGQEKLPYPKSFAYIQTRWDLCTGCGICEAACSMHHYGVINPELSRIRIYRYMLPIPKSVQNVCVHCREEERECQKACPQDPPVIHYDESAMHMKVDLERCLGSACGLCRDACPAEVPHFYSPDYDYSMVCDLCEKNGQRQPRCVQVCPYGALEYLVPPFAGYPHHLERIHPDEKAKALSQRLHPLPLDRGYLLPQEIWSDYNDRNKI